MILLSRRFPLPRTRRVVVGFDLNDSTALDWISQGVVGDCPPPHLVLPLTVEPTKPRLCHDERFPNLWTRDLPFKLDHLPDLPRYVLPGHFQSERSKPSSLCDLVMLSLCSMRNLSSRPYRGRLSISTSYSET